MSVSEHAYDLRGKSVLITGAARGIGEATARAAHARGASVTLLDLDGDDSERAAAAIGERALGLAGDVTDAASLDAAVEAAVARFGGLDVAVANAGIAPTGRTTRVYETELWERVVDVNLLGVWRTVRAALPHVVARRGHLTLVSSIYAFTNGTFVSPYAVSKAGVEQLGRALRVELAPHGVSVGTAYFGFVDTDMVRQSMTDDPLGKRFEERIPLPLRKKISPAAAGEVLARGIERRAPRTIAPRRWAALSMLRGIVNPAIDAAMARDAGVRELVREADVA
ncbi:MAG TPA: short-chain dehydrogenase/reductase [Solirubrobacteraceae bacterium]